MLVCVGGFSGSGKRVLAGNLAQDLGYHHYVMNDKKVKPFTITNKGVVETVRHPVTDAQRTYLYRSVIEDMPRLSKMYPDIVIDNVFHRAQPRDEFFRAAKEYFNDILIVWVERTGNDTQHETNPLRLLKQREEFQPFDPPVPVFSYTSLPKDAQEAFTAFVRELQALLKCRR